MINEYINELVAYGLNQGLVDPEDEVYVGRTYRDAPDIDGKVFIRAKKGAYREGDFARVQITESMDYDLVGEPV